MTKAVADYLFLLVVGVTLGQTLPPDSLWISGALALLALVALGLRIHEWRVRYRAIRDEAPR